MGTYVSDKKNARFFGLKLNRNRDRELIEKLESVPNMQIYLKNLIRADLKRTAPQDIDEMMDAAKDDL